ncbi:hypothetical protein NMG29_30130 [Streptomyces cocklensis]|jgi:uncharacterized membrane protein|uniref:Uncharacterized protein n=1 Tax=Actinacidiphila cocklensis TaxID=887465 RepID=A0A9W4EBG9_9ACTN|nr:hypothetical protein [Actinacidiphila cocklensis]MDD1062433.1 hypothetical protein [Actinacidiphila cocklensis]WSX72547.1 hypothetical protein OH826_00905 [Streptomyces sp. NBC_00899]WSX81384.1 hypothetical protein OH826_50590 [Streptomyces sp. NBC_00899]CAG6398761.1 exported hypothetical protein [Actinacidiphila cocklensis]
MVLVLVAAAVLLAGVIAGTVVVARRSSTPGDLRAEAAHSAVRQYERAFYDARTVHNSAAMGDGFHR